MVSINKEVDVHLLDDTQENNISSSFGKI